MEEGTFLVEYQPLVYSQMKKNVEHERLAHAYLFEGDSGTGKHEMSIWLAKRLFCEAEEKPCNQCINCLRIEMGEHPNVRTVAPDGQTIKVDQIRQLQAEFSKSGFETRQQVFIIQQAEKMNASAANSLLKFLEEPTGSFLAILETNALGRILPTIQSRCQVIHFSPLPKEKLQDRLQKDGITPQTAELLTSLTNSYDKAVEISQDEWFNGAKDIVLKWFEYLKKNDPQSFIFVQKRLLAIAKEKSQQRSILAILLFYFQRERNQFLAQKIQVDGINRNLELILQAQQKLDANVSFQGVAEQLVLRIIQ